MAQIHYTRYLDSKIDTKVVNNLLCGGNSV